MGVEHVPVSVMAAVNRAKSRLQPPADRAQTVFPVGRPRQFPQVMRKAAQSHLGRGFGRQSHEASPPPGAGTGGASSASTASRPSPKMAFLPP